MTRIFSFRLGEHPDYFSKKEAPELAPQNKYRGSIKRQKQALLFAFFRIVAIQYFVN